MFETYPRMQQLISELKLEPYVDTMEWHYFRNEDEIDNKLKEVLTTYHDLTSANISKIVAAKERVNDEYSMLGSKLHVFAREQARHELGLTNEDVTRIFSKVEIGGTRYLI